MESNIPIIFEHQGKQYNSHFSNAMGAGDISTYYLMDNKNFYLGRLRRYNNNWIFDPTPKTQGLKELAEYFGDYITNLHQ